MKEWRIGCSGFHYDAWKEVFYPKGLPKSKWFEYYFERFDTLELNVTFYRFPQLSMLKNWYDKSPDNFTFAVKAPRSITHYRKFNNCEGIIKDFYETVDSGLQKKAACVLFQMPPTYDYSEEKLDLILSLLDKNFVNVLEFRHVTWWRQDVYDRLTKEDVVFCGMSHPTLPENVIQNTDFVYYRFHGRPKLYHSKYSKKDLQAVVDELNGRRQTKQAYMYFNNTDLGHAIEDAFLIKELAEGKQTAQK